MFRFERNNQTINVTIDVNVRKIQRILECLVLLRGNLL